MPVKLFKALALVLTLTLAGCVPPSQITEPEDTSAELAASQALEAGNFEEALRLYSDLLNGARSEEERYRYQLAIAKTYLRGGNLVEARRRLELLTNQPAPPQLLMERQLISAELVLREDDPDRALTILLTPLAGVEQRPLHARYHYLRAQAFAKLGNHIETARELILRERFLDDPLRIESNQQGIWQSLSHLTPEALRAMQIQPPPDVLGGWMRLALISKESLRDPGAMQVALNGWRLDYPQHPVQETFLQSLLERSRELTVRADHIAVLLPMSGPYAQAAAAVRDGILAAHYHAPYRDQVELRFYDTGAGAMQVAATYQQAVEAGAQFIIGPLDKEAVRMLARQEELPLPTLALNYAEPSLNGELYQFALSPENEARQLAERVWLEGYTQAAVLMPHDNGGLGERIGSAFRQRWEELGSQVVANAIYEPGRHDYSNTLKAMLGITDSEQRFREVRRLFSGTVHFEPRRRQDVDFIVLHAFPAQGRLIGPQLKFFDAGDIPVFATSHLYSGNEELRLDQDLQGMRFGDMPWLLGGRSQTEALRETVKPQLAPLYNGQLQRLVAMGLDAYMLAPQVRILEEFPYERYAGETGILQVGDNRRIVRQLQWARFRNGQPELLESIAFEPESNE